jgi:hypothetical protein
MPEILQEIFIHCLPVTFNTVMNSSEPPLVLGRVCRQWRYVAYATPTLWSAIHVAVPLDSPFARTCSHAVRAQAIVSWLSRAGIRPLSISLSAPYCWVSEDQAKDSTVWFFLDIIGPFLPRCRSIHISFHNRVWQSFLEKYFTGNFLFLNHLDLDAGTNNWANEGISNKLKQIFLDKAPGLRMVSLMNYGSQAIRLPLPWQQLTILKLCDETTRSGWDRESAFLIPDALLLLSWCPSLVFCNISLSEPGISHSHGTASSSMITLQSLIGFSVQCDIDPKPFFSHLNTPSLRYIHYRQEAPAWAGAELDGTDKALHAALRPFIQRVIQPIEELQMVATYLTQDDVILCLELFPGLKRLSLSDFGDTLGSPTVALDPSPWDEINRSSISGRLLDRFMCRVNLSHMTREYNEITENLQSLKDQSSDDEWDSDLSTASAPCLCPKLERLSLNGASFPDSMLLSFIRFRSLSYAKYGVSRLHWLCIIVPLGREEPTEILEKVQDLQNQTGVYINVYYGGCYPYPVPEKYSPYRGLASVDINGDPTHTYKPSFGLMLATNE